MTDIKHGLSSYLEKGLPIEGSDKKQKEKEMQFAKLFEPGRIGTMGLKNRIIMAPLGHFSADAKGSPTSRTIDYYVERAKGGVGFIIAGGSSVRPEARVPGMFWLYDDKCIPPLRELSQSVHEYGAKIAIQLNDFGKVLSDKSFQFASEVVDVVCPSPVPWVKNNYVPIIMKSMYVV